ncbi:hypothetical protein SGLAM104S_10609 [Streptomyces glaucescens]
MTDPTPAFPWSCSTAPVMMVRAAPGVSCSRLPSTVSVADLPAIPSRETSTSSAGNSDSTP